MVLITALLLLLLVENAILILVLLQLRDNISKFNKMVRLANKARYYENSSNS